MILPSNAYVLLLFLSLFPKNFNFFRFSLIKRNHSLTLKQTHTVTPILYFQAKMALNCQIWRKSSFSAELGSTKWSSRGVWKWCRKSENFKIFFWKLFLYGRKILSEKNEFKKSLQSSITRQNFLSKFLVQHKKFIHDFKMKGDAFFSGVKIDFLPLLKVTKFW